MARARKRKKQEDEVLLNPELRRPDPKEPTTNVVENLREAIRLVAEDPSILTTRLPNL